MDVHDSTIPLDDKAIARFWSKVDTSGGPDACWPWTGYRNPAGYGRARSPEGMRGAHRVAWSLCRGSIPASLCVLHSCDNRPCCNPSHLRLGTHADNTADAVAKGRMATGDRNGSRTHPERRPRGDASPSRRRPERLARGERTNNAALTDSDVLAIRAEAAGGTRGAALARRYGVDRTTIYKVINGVSWRHLLPSEEAA